MTRESSFRRVHFYPTTSGIALAKAQGKHLGRPSGVDQVALKKVKAALDAGFSINKTVELTDIPATSVKPYRRLLSEQIATK